jgi:hypothetical protein
MIACFYYITLIDRFAALAMTGRVSLRGGYSTKQSRIWHHLGQQV